MKKYLYVVVYRFTTQTPYEPPSFQHHFVNAKDEDTAYDLGGDLLKMEPNEIFLNDYVVEL